MNRKLTSNVDFFLADVVEEDGMSAVESFAESNRMTSSELNS